MANGNVAYWQAVPAADVEEEVNWGCSDGPGLEPAAGSAATCASGAATAAAGAGARVAAGVGAARVSCRESPVPEHLKLCAGALQCPLDSNLQPTADLVSPTSGWE